MAATAINTLRYARHLKAVGVPRDKAEAMAEALNGTLVRPTATRHVWALMAAARIQGPQTSPKGLRHAYGVAAVTAGVPLPTVAAVLGHADLTTTAIYTTAIGAQARELVARMWS